MSEKINRPAYYDWVGTDSQSIAEVARKTKDAALMLASHEKCDLLRQETIKNIILDDGYDDLYHYYVFEFSFFVNYLYYKKRREINDPSAIEVYLYLEVNGCKWSKGEIYQAIHDDRIKSKLREQIYEALIDANELLYSEDYINGNKLEKIHPTAPFEEGFYIPVYPDKEDENKGIKPCLISVREFLLRLNLIYLQAIRCKYKLESDKWLSIDGEKTEIFYNKCIEIIKKVTLQDLAIPYKLYKVVSNIERIKDSDLELVTNLCEQEKFVRLGHSYARGIPDHYNAMKMVAWINGYYDELFEVWQSYLKNNKQCDCFEDFLYKWDDSPERMKYLSQFISEEEMEEMESLERQDYYSYSDYDELICSMGDQ